MSLRIITPPGCFPLDVAQVLMHCRQDVTDENSLVELYLDSATEMVQTLTQRQILAAEYEYALDSFPGPSLMGVPYGRAFSLPKHAILLPRTPLVKLLAIEYTAMDGQAYTMGPDDYVLDASCEPPRITPPFGRIWPINMPQIGSVRVRFIAGYMTQMTADTATNSVALDLWGPLAVGDVLRFSNSGGALPAPLKHKTSYPVAGVLSAGVVTLADSSGNAITLTDAGTGTQYAGQLGLNGSKGEIPGSILSWMLIRSDTLYSWRGEVASTRGIITKLDFVDRLLDPVSVVLA